MKRMKDTETQQGRKKDLLDECGFPGVCEWRVHCSSVKYMRSLRSAGEI